MKNNQHTSKKGPISLIGRTTKKCQKEYNSYYFRLFL